MKIDFDYENETLVVGDVKISVSTMKAFLTGLSMYNLPRMLEGEPIVLEKDKKNIRVESIKNVLRDKGMVFDDEETTGDVCNRLGLKPVAQLKEEMTSFTATSKLDENLEQFWAFFIRNRKDLRTMVPKFTDLEDKFRNLITNYIITRFQYDNIDLNIDYITEEQIQRVVNTLSCNPHFIKWRKALKEENSWEG